MDSRARSGSTVAVCGMSDFATFYRDTEPWIAAAAATKYGQRLARALTLGLVRGSVLRAVHVPSHRVRNLARAVGPRTVRAAVRRHRVQRCAGGARRGRRMVG